MVCTREAWEALDVRDNVPGRGPPVVVGIDLGAAVSLTSAVAVWPDGEIACHNFMGSVPSIVDREDEDGVTGLYQAAHKRGELELISGLRVPPAIAVLSWVANNWGRPRMLVADSFGKQGLLDGVDAMGWPQDELEIRARSGPPIHDDLTRLRSGIDLQSFVRPDCLLLDAAMGRACMRTSKFGGYLTTVKPYGLGPRDDPFSALLLAWPTFERMMTYDTPEPDLPEISVLW